MRSVRFAAFTLVAGAAALALRSSAGSDASLDRPHGVADDALLSAWQTGGSWPVTSSSGCFHGGSSDGLMSFVDEAAHFAAYLCKHGTARTRLEAALHDEVNRASLVVAASFHPPSARLHSELARAVCEELAGAMSHADFVRFSLRQPALAAATAHLTQCLGAFEWLAREHARSAIERREYEFADACGGRPVVPYAPLDPGSGFLLRSRTVDGCIALRVVFADNGVLNEAQRACSDARDALERVLAPLAQAEHEVLAEQTLRIVRGAS